MRRILLARIGWMPSYTGAHGKRRPVGAGSYNETKIGREAFNFLPFDGCMYGYVTTVGPRHRISLEKITGKPEEQSTDGVLILFVAKKRAGEKLKLVGWYSNATVYRKRRWLNVPGRKKYPYYVRAAETDCHPLGQEEAPNEKIIEGKGGIGRANICYMYDENLERKRMPWVDALLKHVDKAKMG